MPPGALLSLQPGLFLCLPLGLLLGERGGLPKFPAGLVQER